MIAPPPHTHTHWQASKLLGGYKAWFNGVPLGMGPGRTYAQGVGVDVYNVSALLRRVHGGGGDGSNVLAVQAFYQPLGFPGAANNSDDAGGVWAALYDGGGGGSLRFGTGPAHLAQWSAFQGADEAFGIGGAPDSGLQSLGAEFIVQPQKKKYEHMLPLKWGGST